MSDIALSVVIAASLSVIISVIEMVSQSKSDLKHCFAAPYFLYVIVLIVGNLAMMSPMRPTMDSGTHVPCCPMTLTSSS